jgi:hypothetical protein
VLKFHKKVGECMKYTCPCCGYKSLDEEPPGTYYICEICYWEDDDVQFRDPDYEGGANEVSLRQAQKNFIRFGACEEIFMESVRKLNNKDIKDPNWKPFI